jgi:hypothetical protein
MTALAYGAIAVALVALAIVGLALVGLAAAERATRPPRWQVPPRRRRG